MPADPRSPARWRPGRASKVTAVLTLGLVTATSAQAFRVIGWDWDWQRNPMADPFYANVSSFPAAVGTQPQVEAALRDAQDIWATEGLAGFSFDWGGATARTSFSADGVFISQYSSQAVAGGTLAVSQSWGWGDEMTECDQRYYRANGFGPIDWSADPNGASVFEIDLEHTAIHEYGHCAGLDHSSNANAIMYASTTGGMGPGDRHLHPDDVAGLQSMYGAVQGSSLNLALNGSVITGQPHSYTVTGANPGERVYLLYSEGGVGPGPCPQILNNGAICVGVRGPLRQLGFATANNQGTATITATLNTIYQGWGVGFQAGVLRGVNNRDTVLSQALSAVGLPPGLACPGGTIPDCGGACWDGTWVGDGYCDDGRVYPWGNANFACDAFLNDDGDCP